MPRLRHADLVRQRGGSRLLVRPAREPDERADDGEASGALRQAARLATRPCGRRTLAQHEVVGSEVEVAGGVGPGPAGLRQRGAEWFRHEWHDEHRRPDSGERLLDRLKLGQLIGVWRSAFLLDCEPGPHFAELEVQNGVHLPVVDPLLALDPAHASAGSLQSGNHVHKHKV